MAVGIVRTSAVLGSALLAYKSAVWTNYSPTSWAIASLCAWLSHTSITGWRRMSTWEQRHLLWGMTSILAFLHFLALDPSFKSWEDVFFFCGRHMEYCSCTFRWNSRGWTKAAVLWNFTLSSALALQKLVISLGLNSLLPGEDLVTKESFISIGWRLIPYWLNNWEQQWGAECSSMIFELPHFALELLVVLPCAQIVVTRLKILAQPHVILPAPPPRPLAEANGREGVAGQLNLPRDRIPAGDQIPHVRPQQQEAGEGGVARGAEEEVQHAQHDLVPDVLRCVWVADRAQRRLLPRLKANIRIMAMLVLLSGVALFNAVVVPLVLEGEVSRTERSSQILGFSTDLEYLTARGRVAEMARWYEALIHEDIQRAHLGVGGSGGGSTSSRSRSRRLPPQSTGFPSSSFTGTTTVGRRKSNSSSSGGGGWEGAGLRDSSPSVLSTHGDLGHDDPAPHAVQGGWGSDVERGGGGSVGSFLASEGGNLLESSGKERYLNVLRALGARWRLQVSQRRMHSVHRLGGAHRGGEQRGDVRVGGSAGGSPPPGRVFEESEDPGTAGWGAGVIVGGEVFPELDPHPSLDPSPDLYRSVHQGEEAPHTAEAPLPPQPASWHASAFAPLLSWTQRQLSASTSGTAFPNSQGPFILHALGVDALGEAGGEERRTGERVDPGQGPRSPPSNQEGGPEDAGGGGQHVQHDAAQQQQPEKEGHAPKGAWEMLAEGGREEGPLAAALGAHGVVLPLEVSLLSLKVAGGGAWAAPDNVTQVSAELAAADLAAAHAVDARLAALCTLWEPLLPMHWLYALHMPGDTPRPPPVPSSTLWALQFRPRPSTPALLHLTRAALEALSRDPSGEGGVGGSCHVGNAMEAVEAEVKLVPGEGCSSRGLLEADRKLVGGSAGAGEKLGTAEEAVRKLGELLVQLDGDARGQRGGGGAAGKKMASNQGGGGVGDDADTEEQGRGSRHGIWALLAALLGEDSPASKGITRGGDAPPGQTPPARGSSSGAADARRESDSLQPGFPLDADTLAHVLLTAVAASDLDPLTDAMALGEGWLVQEGMMEEGSEEGRLVQEGESEGGGLLHEVLKEGVMAQEGPSTLGGVEATEGEGGGGGSPVGGRGTGGEGGQGPGAETAGGRAAAGDLRWLRARQRQWDRMGCLRRGSTVALYKALRKHCGELRRMQQAEHRTLIPLVEVSLAVMRLSCENFFSLTAVFAGYLLFRDPPPAARRVIVGIAGLSHAFQRAILYAFPAVCWVYGAGFIFSSFVSVVFWTGPLLRALERMRTAASTVLPRSWHPATPEELERMGGQCAVCWGDMGGGAADAAGTPGSATAAASASSTPVASPVRESSQEDSAGSSSTPASPSRQSSSAEGGGGRSPSAAAAPQEGPQAAVPGLEGGPRVAEGGGVEEREEAAGGGLAAAAEAAGFLGGGTSGGSFGSSGSSRAMGLQCGHAYHEECLLQWLHQCYGQARQPTCPMCQATIRLKVTYRLPFSPATPDPARHHRQQQQQQHAMAGAGMEDEEGEILPPGGRDLEGIPGIRALVLALQDDFVNRFEPMLMLGEGGDDAAAWGEDGAAAFRAVERDPGDPVPDVGNLMVPPRQQDAQDGG